MQILTEHQDQLLKDERKLLHRLNDVLAEFGASAEDKNTLMDSIEQLDELFLLVVVGEFNAGKSALINALLGNSFLKEGVTPTTTQINLIRYGEDVDQLIVTNKLVITLPVDWLDEISIVDTPGTNAIVRSHEEITSKFVPRSDLVLFITSADRPFTESERRFLENIRDWGKKVVLVINKIDILDNEDDLDQVRKFVLQNAQELLGVVPELFPVSARQALKAKNGEMDLWERSRFEPLETFIQETLDEQSRLQLKFMNPLGVAQNLSSKYAKIIQSRIDMLDEDQQMLADVEGQLAVYKEDMYREFKFRMSDIENILYEMDQRGQDYFDRTFRLSRVFDLLSKDRIKSDFEEQVVANLPEQIDKKVEQLIDWLVDSDLRQWQAVNDYLADRRRTHRDRVVGDDHRSSFHYDRERLITELGREAQRVVEKYDKTSEAKSIAEGAQIAVAASAALEVSAVGLGTLVAVLATTAAADITGVLLASLVAALGLFVIPTRKKIAKAEMRQKVGELRQQLITTLRTQFESEIERSILRINDAISPYTRFIRSEHKKFTSLQDRLNSILEDSANYKNVVETFK